MQGTFAVRFTPGNPVTMPTRLTFPVAEEGVRALRVGEDVLVSGRVLTAREAAHRHLVGALDPRLAELAAGAAIFHCAPAVARDAARHGWRLVAAGPSPSARLEPYEADVLSRYGVRAILGKGGMGARTLEALARHGAVYLHAAGGLAVALARRVVRVDAVHLLDELGVAQAVWVLEVRDFPAVVTMDAHGASLHVPAGPAADSAGPG